MKKGEKIGEKQTRKYRQEARIGGREGRKIS